MIQPTNIRILHLGYQEPSELAGKIERNLRLIDLDLEERPGDPVPLSYKGTALHTLGRHEEAIACLEQARPFLDPACGMARTLCVTLANALRATQQLERAMVVTREARQNAMDDAGLACMEAELLIERGSLEVAEVCLAPIALDARIVLSMTDVCARVLHGELLLRLNRFEEAESCARRTIELRPSLEPAWRVLADALLGQARHDDLLDLASALSAVEGSSSLVATINDAVRSRTQPPTLSCRKPPWTVVA